MNGKELQRLRKSKKITQAQVADAIGTTSQTISSWEKGWTTPNVDDFVVIAKTIGISPVELFWKVCL